MKVDPDRIHKIMEYAADHHGIPKLDFTDELLIFKEINIELANYILSLLEEKNEH